ncbi:MAG: sodium-dependent transporter [Elusimicrobia bacterium]|nr:sodium-dependent transporter [Elusimicrobiota bacterium]
MSEQPSSREHWGTRIGLVLAMAGNAIGLGNFLRFPVQATQNGGGAFMIPYFCALLCLGVPLMWCEWAMGRLGGSKGHGTTPGIFTMLWKHPMAKYLGLMGIVFPLGVVFYYNYVEAWTLAYAVFSATGKYFGIADVAGMKGFLSTFQGASSPLGVSLLGYVFFLITFGINVWILSGGISKGIERLANIGMPVLFLFAILLVIRVFTLGAPDPALPENTVVNGLGFIWNPDFSQLANSKVWLAAAGQIFFTLSVGFGAIQCYASYLREKDDVVVTGLSTASANEFVEVILGGSLAIPIAFAFFGRTETLSIAQGGSFNLGFAAMPIIFQKLALGQLLGMMWFFLLFIAGITSSVALMQPLITFLKDELGYTHRKALTATAALCFVMAHVVIFGLHHGTLDEIDFWCGTFGVALFALAETLIFVWIFGPDNAWAEIEKGAQVPAPRIFYYVMKYVTPLYLLVLFVSWTWQQGPAVLTMEGVAPADRVWRWGARLAMLGVFLGLCWLASRSKRLKELTEVKP